MITFKCVKFQERKQTTKSHSSINWTSI